MTLTMSAAERASLLGDLSDADRALIDRSEVILACARKVMEATGAVFDMTMKVAGEPPSYDFSRGELRRYAEAVVRCAAANGVTVRLTGNFPDAAIMKGKLMGVVSWLDAHAEAGA